METKKRGRTKKKTYADGTPKKQGIKKNGDKKKRPGRKTINATEEIKIQIKTLFQVQCTEEEVASIIGWSKSKLHRWLQQGNNLEEYKNTGMDAGKVSLRKKMFQNAIQNNNTQMQIHLSKQYLGMSDKVETINTNVEINELTDDQLMDLLNE